MITFILGDIPLLQDRALAKLREDQQGRVPETYFGSEMKAKQLQEACCNLSLLGETSFILLREVERLPRKEQVFLEGFWAEVPAETVLVVMAHKVDRRVKCWQQLVKAAQVISCEAPAPRERRRWLQQECQQRGLQVAPEAFEILIEAAMGDINQALLLLDKIDLYLGEASPVDLECVEACAIGGAPGKIFEWAEAVGAGRWQQAFQLLQILWAHQEAPLALLALLIRHYRLLLKTVENQSLWGRRQELARVLGVPPFAVDRYVQQGRRYQRTMLLHIWDLLQQTDRALKSSPLRKELELEALLLELKKQQKQAGAG